MNEEINEINGSSNNPILDIVNELQSKLNEPNNTTNTNNNNNTKNADLSGLDIPKMLEMLKNTNNNSSNNKNTSNTNNSSLLNLDLNSIMNLKNAITSINQTDPRQELLTSLKPFLRETRKKNIDNYITLLGVMKAINLFTSKDRD